jgi:hypothetical protein
LHSWNFDALISSEKQHNLSVFIFLSSRGILPTDIWRLVLRELPRYEVALKALFYKPSSSSISLF